MKLRCSKSGWASKWCFLQRNADLRCCSPTALALEQSSDKEPADPNALVTSPACLQPITEAAQLRRQKIQEAEDAILHGD